MSAQTLTKRAVTETLLSYSRVRGFGFASQFFFLASVASLLPSGKKGKRKPIPFSLLKVLHEQAEKLIHQDIQNIQTGIYPATVLVPESPLEHLKRIPKVMWDGLKVQIRRTKGESKNFSKHARKLFDQVPDYYQRTFHYQTDGYLSEHSAELYEHQVEMLFGGMAGPMRRQIVTALRAHFGSSDGTGLRFLEVGAGTGSATRFVQLAFPKAKIVLCDLSAPYLKHSAKKLHLTCDTVQGDGAHLDTYQDGVFDAVYSVYLFHELPESARADMIREGYRLLKSGGFYGLVDSVQRKDLPELSEVLEGFAQEYHEPFYRNYIDHPIEDVLKCENFSDIRSGQGYLAKWVSAAKP